MAALTDSDPAIACTGQELFLLEMKLALIMMVRRFDFSMKFEEWDQKHGKWETGG